MKATVAPGLTARHLLSSDIKPKMAKVSPDDVRKAETDDDWKLRVGQAVDGVRADHKLSLKEFSAAIQRDERQVARWIEGKEHAQIAAVFAVARFRCGLVIALAKLAGSDVEVTTHIAVKSHASDGQRIA